ncbi:MAG: RNA methyltransferase [Thermodesulfobacteriota bacterium]|nr:RNA methyltransferase [Thermodesulfobacteriota bacterium]
MKADLDNFCVILHEPRYPENIGAAARCCHNMGIHQLIVVRPYRPDMEKMLKMATHEAADLIETMLLFDDLEEALGPFQHVAGTTARTGRQRLPTHTPRTIAKKLIDLGPKNRIALLFGSEKCGLTNSQLRLCQSLVNIPTTAFSSINLAQSVMILCYELFIAKGYEEKVHPKLATTRELEGMYKHLKKAFMAVELTNPQNPEYWTDNARRLLGRQELRAREAKMIRGFCQQILWAIKNKKHFKQ